VDGSGHVLNVHGQSDEYSTTKLFSQGSHSLGNKKKTVQSQQDITKHRAYVTFSVYTCVIGYDAVKILPIRHHL
jgi:hypothetical protein